MQDDEGLSEEKERELAEIKEMLKQLGPDVSSDLASLKEMVERQQQQQRAEAGPPDIVEDLWPAQRVLADAIQKAQLEKADDTLRALERLETLVATVSGDLPARRIMVRCERALAYLSQEALDRASVELAIAYDIADNSPFARLVPGGVASLIQNEARSQISAGRASAAISVIETVREKCAAHESLQRLARISDGVDGARDAVQRGAWSVVEAELFEIHREMNDLAQTLQVERWDLGTRQPEGWSGAEEETAESGPVEEEGTEAPTPGVDTEETEGVTTDEAPEEETSGDEETAAPRPLR